MYIDEAPQPFGNIYNTSIFLQGVGISAHSNDNKVSKTNATGSDDMACGPGAGNVTATLRPENATAHPGSKIQIHWGGHWDFAVFVTAAYLLAPLSLRLLSFSGLLMTYLAPCPTPDCLEPRNLTWYLFNEAGKRPDNITWYLDGYKDPLGSSTLYNLTLPEDLPNGTYLLRHEVRLFFR